MHREEAVRLQEVHQPETVMELLLDAEAHRLVILHALEEVIPPDAAADTTERKGQITRSLLLQV